MKKSGVSRITMSLPPELLQSFEQVISSIGYDRSKALQQAMRDFITEYQWEYDPLASAVGTVTLIYDHNVRDVETQLTNIQHSHTQIISSTTHIHLDSDYCLLVIVVNGRAEEIQQLAKQIRSLRGVNQLKVTSLMTSVPGAS